MKDVHGSIVKVPIGSKTRKFQIESVKPFKKRKQSTTNLSIDEVILI